MQFFYNHFSILGLSAIIEGKKKESNTILMSRLYVSVETNHSHDPIFVTVLFDL